MSQALFLNGVFQSVLEEVLQTYRNNSNLTCYLQPYTSRFITLLRDELLSSTNPIKLYISTTSNLNLVEYTADIVGWNNKGELDSAKLEELNNHIKKNQPNETDIYLDRGDPESPCVNLISIKNLKSITNPFSVKRLIKTSDKKPCKPRTQAGGWSYVEPIPDWIEVEESGFGEKVKFDLEEKIKKSKKDSSEVRRSRLSNALKTPDKIQITSIGFKRNADVITEVLLRANGMCEQCNNDAPFIRRKDNTPYLEVHHKVTLADGGEDTIENAIAICPNCHRELHFGV
ncbi:HNH endonuclease [Candidatus Woesearchaeota archaeon]|jgi:predicted HNH restriction endonuclease|nr:HNH endonuclease [Candidatus Woesearchaeota archaeon]MBT7558889.1 HNH endonuclease [Candidatus Woesearchaeota archaeon]